MLSLVLEAVMVCSHADPGQSSVADAFPHRLDRTTGFLRLTRRVRFAHLQDVGRNSISARCWNHSANGADPGKQTTSDDRGFAACRASGGRFAPKTLVVMRGEAQFSALAPTS